MSTASGPGKNKLDASCQAGFVSIIGRPNVGKSTLINHVLGEKIAIVSDKPQTTRNRILGVQTFPNAQIVLLDTPGIHKPKHELNRRMVKTAMSTLEEVDLVLFMVESFHQAGEGDRFIIEQLRRIKTPVFLILNKIDLVPKPTLLPLIDEYSRHYHFSEILPISAKNGDNLTALIESIIRYLPEREPIFPEDMLTDQPLRFISAELIREKILNHTKEELPYSVAVGIEDFKEDSAKNLVSISAVIYVDRESQKGIVIGKAGAMLKKVGTEARMDLERLIGCRVFIQLWVKVRENWRGSDALLAELGY